MNEGVFWCLGDAQLISLDVVFVAQLVLDLNDNSLSRDECWIGRHEEFSFVVWNLTGDLVLARKCYSIISSTRTHSFILSSKRF
jgi:hypothetical protein